MRNNSDSISGITNFWIHSELLSILYNISDCTKLIIMINVLLLRYKL